MNELFCKAIEEKRRLRFNYRGVPRLAEPQCYGLGHRGTELLRVHQLRTGSEREPLFEVPKMHDVELLDDVFTKPGPNYKRNDSAMKIIFCQL
ncbi:MAG TPA: hypothetical protein VNA44_06730 [Burkholderiaceae bacterium]|nr:hypothetical protein [Burkholderiaceae bacterium]